eukprot:2277416-Amphidinium_carterae.1
MSDYNRWATLFKDLGTKWFNFETYSMGGSVNAGGLMQRWHQPRYLYRAKQLVDIKNKDEALIVLANELMSFGVPRLCSA